VRKTTTSKADSIKTERELGTKQKDVLRALGKNGGVWHPGAGWYCGSRYETIMVLRTLVKRGMVTEEEHEGTPLEKFTLTEKGKERIGV
jgi:hypothetical protein